MSVMSILEATATDKGNDARKQKKGGASAALRLIASGVECV